MRDRHAVSIVPPAGLIASIVSWLLGPGTLGKTGHTTAEIATSVFAALTAAIHKETVARLARNGKHRLLRHRTVYMYDDVNVDLIPRNARYIAAYVDGRYANYNAARRRFPKARVFSISVTGVPADWYDIEPGCMSFQQGIAAGLRDIREGRTPGYYCDRDVYPVLISALRAGGIRTFRRWSAHWTGHPHICSPRSCGAPFVADGTQYSGGQVLDESLVSLASFGAAY